MWWKIQKIENKKVCLNIYIYILLLYNNNKVTIIITNKQTNNKFMVPIKGPSGLFVSSIQKKGIGQRPFVDGWKPRSVRGTCLGLEDMVPPLNWGQPPRGWQLLWQSHGASGYHHIPVSIRGGFVAHHVDLIAWIPKNPLLLTQGGKHYKARSTI